MIDLDKEKASRPSLNERFHIWMEGEQDLYIGELEMKPPKNAPGQTGPASQNEAQSAVQNNLSEGARPDSSSGAEENTELRRQIPETLINMVENNDRITPASRRPLKIAFDKAYPVLATVMCIAIVILLLVTVSWMPPFGSADNPTSNEVAERYIEQGLTETGAVNIVSGMILDYRAFDTLGESNVLFIATIAVMILMRVDSKEEKEKLSQEEEVYTNEKTLEPKNDVIIKTVAFFLVPLLLIFGIYIILCGHLGPGGGFSGGAVIGASLILYANAYGFQRMGKLFTAKTYKVISFCALGFYALAKSYSFFTGANELESFISTGVPGRILSAGLILPLNICVGLVVACTMYSFYVLFRKGGY
ncbi:MAG: hypothetical protein LUC90_12280 [Lachnospiraceae bacterium]|nr:hypothetical protein [Lachnospiraceae bacterium]